MNRLLDIIGRYWLGTATILFAATCVYVLWRTL